MGFVNADFQPPCVDHFPGGINLTIATDKDRFGIRHHVLFSAIIV